MFKRKYTIPEYVFACETIEDLKVYFRPEELQSLEKLGFFVYEITVPEDGIIYGKRQLVYKKDDVVNVQRFNFNLTVGEWQDIDKKFF